MWFYITLGTIFMVYAVDLTFLIVLSVCSGGHQKALRKLSLRRARARRAARRALSPPIHSLSAPLAAGGRAARARAGSLRRRRRCRRRRNPPPNPPPPAGRQRRAPPSLARTLFAAAL